ncbi:MAG: hypothetical protein JNK47_02210 [Mesorhizobium sp.]|nr:hypothetical protein [Mesorhizobium sp.]MBL8576013.1 hypothetical protein [Mesorhizobium sp.]
MFSSGFWILIVIEAVTGALSGALLGNLVPPLSLGGLKNAVLGAIGGVGLTWLTAQTPALESLVEDVAPDGSYVLSPELLLSVGVAGLIGGALLVTIIGLLRNRFAA